MLFKKKTKREIYDDFIMDKIAWYKRTLELEKEFMEKSYDLPEDIVFQYKVNCAKYFYFIQEAKYRKIDVSNRKYR